MFKLFKKTPQKQLDELVWNKIKDFDFNEINFSFSFDLQEIEINENIILKYFKTTEFSIFDILYKNKSLEISYSLKDKIERFLSSIYYQQAEYSWSILEKKRNKDIERQINLLLDK